MLLLAVAAIACLQWIRRTSDFKTLVDVRLRILEEMEKDSRLNTRIRPVFRDVADALGQTDANKIYDGLKYTYERPVLPMVFLFAHLLAMVVAVEALLSGGPIPSLLVVALDLLWVLLCMATGA